MPTIESALTELAAAVAERAAIPAAETLGILQAHLGTDNGWGILQAACREPRWSAQFTVASDQLLHLPALVAGRVFTHRITIAEVAADEIDLTRDAPPLVRALADGFRGILAGRPLTATAGAATRLDVPDSEDVQVLRLAPGSLAGAGLAPGTLLTLRATFAPQIPTAGVLGPTSLMSPSTVQSKGPAAAAASPQIARDDRGSMSQSELRPNSAAVHLHIDVLTDEPTGSDFADAFADDRLAVENWVTVEHMIMLTLLRHPELLRQPSPPISEGLASVGIGEDAVFVCPPHEDVAATLRSMRIDDFAQTYRLTKPQATTLTDAIFWLIARESALVAADKRWASAGCHESGSSARPDSRPDLDLDLNPELRHDIDTALADEWWTLVLADAALTLPMPTPRALAELAHQPTAGQSRATRGHRRYLAGRAAEALGHPQAAAAHYRAADQLIDCPDALLHLAGIEADCGDFAAAGALLERAQTPASHPLVKRIGDVLAHRKATEPQRPPRRNERCWCGTGLKYKMCHGRAGTTGPLAERARSLNARVTWFLTDTTHDAMARLIDVATAAAGGAEPPDDELGPWLVDVIAAEGGAMRSFRELRGELLPVDELALLDAWLTTSRALYEVTDAAPGEWFDLRDVVTGEVARAVDDFRGPPLQRGDLVCARLAPMGGATEPFAMAKVQPYARDAWLNVLASDPTPAQLTELWASGYAEPVELTIEGHPREVWTGILTTDDPPALASHLNTLFDDHDEGCWDFSEPVTAPSGMPVWTEPVTLDLVGNDLTVVAWSQQRYEMTLARLDALPLTLTEIACYPSDTYNYVHPIRGTYEDDEEWPLEWDDEYPYA